MTHVECGEKVALVLPLFFPSTASAQQTQQDCHHSKSCILSFVFSISFTCSAWKKLPQTQKALRQLLINGHRTTYAPTAARHAHVLHIISRVELRVHGLDFPSSRSALHAHQLLQHTPPAALRGSSPCCRCSGV